MTIKTRSKARIVPWGAIFVSVALLAMMAGPALGASGIQVLVDGQEINYGDTPVIATDGHTYTGVRSMARALGVPEDRIKWDGPTQTVSLSKDNTIVVLILGNKVMQVNDGIVTMDTAPFATNESIYLPVRYLAEAFGYTVEWNESTQQALIKSPAPVEPADAAELTEADSDKTVTIAVGERITVALESNPSTNYSWIMAQGPDAAILSSSPVQFEPGAVDVPGAPGTERWVFDGVAKGSTSFSLNYTRPGSNEIPAKIFKLNVVVE